MPHRNWQQANAVFPDRSTAGHLFTAQAGPVLRQAEADGAIASWFFLRKCCRTLRMSMAASSGLSMCSR